MDTKSFIIGAIAGSFVTVVLIVVSIIALGAVTIARERPGLPPDELPPAPPRPRNHVEPTRPWSRTYVEPGSLKRSTARAEHPSYLERSSDEKKSIGPPPAMKTPPISKGQNNET